MWNSLVVKSTAPNYGRTTITISNSMDLFRSFPLSHITWEMDMQSPYC